MKKAEDEVATARRLTLRRLDLEAYNHPYKKLHNRMVHALETCECLTETPLAELTEACQTMFMATSYSKECCELFAHNSDHLRVILMLIKSCTRSVPHQQLLRYGSHILILYHSFIHTYNMIYIPLSTYSLALSVLLNACQHPSIASVLAADETADCVDALVDVIQMFRDIAVITCLTSDVLDRLLTSNTTVLQQVTIFNG